MRAHVIEGGRIVNTIVVDALDALPGLTLIDADLHGGCIGDGWDGTNIIPFVAPVVVPQVLAPVQFFRSLNHFSLRATCDAYVAASTDPDLKDWYARSSIFERKHPLVLKAMVDLNLSDAQADAVWTYGASLP